MYRSLRGTEDTARLFSESWQLPFHAHTVWSMWDGTFGSFKEAQRQSSLQKTDSCQRIHSSPYPLGQGQREIKSLEMDWVLSMDKIEPAQTEWSTPVLFVPGNGLPLGFRVNIQSSNAMRRQDSYPISCSVKWIKATGDTKMFSTLNGSTRYWNVEIGEDQRNKTVFTSHHAMFRLTHMWYGMENGPETF